MWSKRREIKQKGVFIKEDFPSEILQRRKLILPTFFQALKLCPQLNPKLLLDSFILNGKVYNVNNAHTVPVEELLPRNVFTCTNGNVTAYFDKYSPLSNHYPCKFNQEGVCFYSVEQCFMYQKDAQFKDQETADKMLETKCPVEAKQLGKGVKRFNPDVCEKAASDIMYNAMYEKFAQNEEL